MEKETIGTVVAVKKQWWLKINTKPFRTHPLDGAIFPHIVKVKYVVGEKEFVCRKWVKAGVVCPNQGSFVKVFYLENKPKKCKIIF